MHQVADELILKLNRLVKEAGGKEAVIDIWDELHSVSIEAMGRSAFGRKINAIESYSPFASYVEGMMRYSIIICIWDY